MAYYQYDEDSDTPQNWEEYHAKWGNQPGQEGWENLSRPERDWIKKGRAPYQGFSEQEQEMMGDIWSDIQEGSPADISGLEELVERYQMSPGIRQYLIKKVKGLFKGGPDYQDVYAAQKGKLDVEMRGQERALMERQSARGLLDTSGTQARLGALQGAYSGTLADLLMGTAEMTERTRHGRMGQGLELMRTGLGWQESDIQKKTGLETLRNLLYMQDIGLQTGALDFLGQERGRENQYNLGFASLPQDEPMTGLSGILGLIQAGASMWGASQGMGSYDFGGGGSDYDIPEAPPSGETWENYDWF